jgi:hypothetical protein
MPDRLRQIAEHEIRFREINERLATDVRGVSADDALVEFVCECGVVTCTETVSLTLAEYDRVRGDGATFAVLPGHEIADAEAVVQQLDRFFVVRKLDNAAPLARRTDPRSPG